MGAPSRSQPVFLIRSTKRPNFVHYFEKFINNEQLTIMNKQPINGLITVNLRNYSRIMND